MTLSQESRCVFDGCDKAAVVTVDAAAGPQRLCGVHAQYVRQVEREWDDAEAEYLEQ